MELIIGKIVNTYGLKGELKVFSYSDFSKKRYQKGKKVILYSPEGEKVEVIIDTHKQVKGIDIISFKDMKDINLVEKYKNYEIRILKEDDLPNEYYYFVDLIGCKIMHKEKNIGIVIQVLDSGNQHNLRIKKNDGKTFLYPFIGQFLKKVDIENKTIFINPLDGMLDL